MKRAIVERNIIAVLFIAVLVAFSFAHRDSEKLDKLYTQVILTGTEVLITHSASHNFSSN